MNFILKHDLLTKVKKNELDILLADSIMPEGAELDACIVAAELEIKSYIRHRYDVEKAMPPIWYFDPAQERQTDDHVILYVEHEYDVVETYALNDLVLIAATGRVYRSLIAGNTGNNPAASPLTWIWIGMNKTFYKSLIDDNDNDPINASWQALIEDPRDALLKRFHVDLALYDLHARIKPRQIPEHRIALRDDAIALLRDAANPRKNVTFDLPLIDHGDRSGVDLTHGSNHKITHAY